MEQVRLREQEVGAGVRVAARDRKGGQQVGVVAGLSSHRRLFLQELSKREVVAVGHLEVPAELAGLLQAVVGMSVRDSVVGVGTGGRGNQASHTLHSPQASGQPRYPGWPPCGLHGSRLSPVSHCPWISTTTPWPSLSGATSR